MSAPAGRPGSTAFIDRRPTSTTEVQSGYYPPPETCSLSSIASRRSTAGQPEGKTDRKSFASLVVYEYTIYQQSQPKGI
jgi:hypothetical protein